MIKKEGNMTETHQMTKAESRELKSLVKAEYAVLQKELERRVKDLTDQARDLAERQREAIQEQHNATLAPFERQYATIERNYDKAVAALTEKMKAGGLKLAEHSIRWTKATATFSHWAADTSVVDEQYRQATRAINQEYWNVQRVLDRQEQDMIRELTLNNLETEAARAFFDDIPTAAELLPSPEQLTALEG